MIRWVALGVYLYGVVAALDVTARRLDPGDALLVAASWPAIMLVQALEDRIHREGAG